MLSLRRVAAGLVLTYTTCRIISKRQNSEILPSELMLLEADMMPKRRSPNLIATQILEICISGASKTRVVYQANLNSSIGRQYLENMVKNGLLEAIPDGARTIYKTTPKGMSLKGRLVQYRDMMNDLYVNA